MLDRLQRRLTVLFSLLTAAVLAAALALTCRMAQSEYRAGADLLFANTVAAVEDAVTQNGMVRDSWLARQEIAGRVVIYLEDNGQPLRFPGGWKEICQLGRLPKRRMVSETASARAFPPVVVT